MKAVLNWILARRARRLRQRLQPYLPPAGRVLDVGSGTGHNAVAIECATGLQVTELDVSDLNTLGRPVVLYDGRTIPFGDRCFDLVTMLFVLHYVPEPLGLLRELRRVSRSQVAIVQSVYDGPAGRAALWVREWTQGRLAWQVASRLGFVPRGRCPLQPLHYYTRTEVADLFREAGFRVTAHEGTLHPYAPLSRDLYLLEGCGP